MTTRFRLLGDLDVRVDGRVVDVGHARQRCVLAVLLVNANRAVPVDQMIDRVWADRAPQRATGAVYNYMSRLRQALAGADDVRIVSRSGGHVLLVDPLAVDLHEFRDLITRARLSDDDAERLGLLERALGLWRGEPLATLDTPWLNAVRDELARHRLAAELDRNDAALRLGDHAWLLADLATAATGHPLDERMAGQLMLAQYRSGRQADALAHFDRTRQRLADELGTDPGPALRQLHLRILTGDPSLSAPPATGRPSAEPVVPRQLPAPPSTFAGRIDELALLDSMLAAAGDPPNRVAIGAVVGSAGVGKTALAVHWAHRVADRFPDGQVYVNLRGFAPGGSPMDPSEAIRRCLDTFGVPGGRVPATLDAQAALYRSVLATRRVLIVLDNARDAEQVRPLLPGGPTAFVVVTSRDQMIGLVAADGARPIPVDLLSAEESRQLLRDRLGQERVSTAAEATGDIIAQCARLPLALTIVAARAATRPRFPLALLADELRERRRRLEGLAGGDAASDIRAVFSWSYQALTPAAAGLFRLLGLSTGPEISAPAAASLAGLPPPEVRPLLAELARAHLIGEPIPGRYVIHDLLRGYANELAYQVDADEHCDTAGQRLVEHYLHTGYTGSLLLDPTRDPIDLVVCLPGVTPERLTDPDQALAWFTTEHPVLLAVVEYTAGAKLDVHTWQLAWTLTDALLRKGLWRDHYEIQRTALAAASRLSDVVGQARAHRLLARASIRLGRLDDAHGHFHQSLDLFARADDTTGQAHAQHGLADLHGRQGDLVQAIEHERRALHLFRTAGHRAGQARASNGLGEFHARLGHHQQAITSYERALAGFTDVDDRIGRADTLSGLGGTRQRLGDYTRAVTDYREALDLYRELGDRYYQAVVLAHLAETYHAAGQRDPAGDASRQARRLLDGLDNGDPEQVRSKLRHLASR
jgi:DNA-binding SARP family transcriptional activator/tetratricopeptide (TPR) repeat protein